MVFMVAMLVGGATTLRSALQHTQQEEKTNREFAQQLIEAQIKLLATYPYIEVRPEQLVEVFKLGQFRDSDYLHIALYNATGRQLSANFAIEAHYESVLTRLLKNLYEPTETIRREIKVGDVVFGQIVLSPHRAAQINTVIKETSNTILPIIVLFIVFMSLITALVTWVVRPVVDFVTNIQPEHETNKKAPVKWPRLMRLSTQLEDIGDEFRDSTQKVAHLNKRLIDLQEEERRRISAELHDALGQHLTAIRFESAAIKMASTLDETKQSAEAIENIGIEMRDIIRSMLERLRPPRLAEEGLEAALLEMINEWRLRHREHQVDYVCEADLSLIDSTTQLNLYRVVQEALTNVSRHAGEQSVQVEIRFVHIDKCLVLKIQDNGQGCDLGLPHKGFGLVGMQERIEQSGGSVLLTSQIGMGMAVQVKIPLVMQEIA
jgi:two-component system sensor histidine kinase UhpB